MYVVYSVTQFFFVTKAMALSLREIYEVYRAVATSADIVVT